MKRLRVARKRNGERKNGWPHWPTAMRVGIGVVTWAALSLILFGYNLFPGRLSLRVGETSPVLVRAPRMAQYVDQDETERLRREAESRISPQYSPLPYARADAEKRVSQDFAALREARKPGATADAIGKELPWLSKESVGWLVSAPASALDGLEDDARGVVRELMGKEVRAHAGDLRAAREEVDALARRTQRNPEAAALVAEVAKRQIAPNRRLDTEAEEAERAEARQRVQEVVRTIDADQPVIFEGERVTREHLDMLRALGLTSPRLDYRRLVSTVLIVGLIVLLLGLQTRNWARQVYEKPKSVLLLSLLAVASLFVMNLITLALPNIWMLIVPAAALMAATLLADTIGMALALSLSLLVGLMANAGFPAMLLALGSAATALAFSSQLWPVSRLRVVVGAMAAANLVLVAAVGLLQSEQAAAITREALLAAGLYSPGAA
ncbi:MAG: hypothetical protein MUQ65_05370, partial [Armatimonadetes bacterium]|nr:hypothetical protein [Armatimonadota bacterium]